MLKTRRRRNRKKRMEGAMFPVPVASLLIAFGVVAVSYLWMISRCEAIGAEIKSLEAAEAALTETFLNEELKWTRLRSPSNLERILARNGVRMNWPARGQVVLLAHAGMWDLEDSGDAVTSEVRYAGVGRTGRYE